MLPNLAMGQSEPYKNPNLSADERAADLLSRMTLEEKISQMMNNSPEVERLGVPGYKWWNEALHGVARMGTATVFPQAIGLAATFDEQAVCEMFSIVSDEARAKYNLARSRNSHAPSCGLTFWTPNVNIYRDPRWGRGMETYGEDPYLTSRMGIAAVKGLQGDGKGKYDKTHACAKHYAVHSGPEWSRHSFNVEDLDTRDLWETYLPAFKALVQEGGVREVMCAYNAFEGEPCCSSKKLLNSILRDEWGFQDVVVSDCGAIGDFFREGTHRTHAGAPEASADAVLSGTDLECGGEYHSLQESVEKGLIREENIDRSVFRLLRARFQLGLFDAPSLLPWSGYDESMIASEEHRAKALEMARKSIVLLSNPEKTLPLDKDLRKVAVIGPNAADSVMLWANYNGFPTRTVTILQGIRRKLPEGAVIYEQACGHVASEYMESCFNLCSFGNRPGFKATYWNNKKMEGEPVAVGQNETAFMFDTGGNTVFAPGVNLENFSARYETILVPDRSGQMDFMLTIDDGARLMINDETVISSWEDGGQRDQRYSMFVEEGKSYKIVLEYYNAGGTGCLQFDLGMERKTDIERTVAQVADADVIVFVGGISPRLEGEEMYVNYPGFRGGDRTNIEFPEIQKRMLRALKTTGKPVVLVVCSGSTMALAEENELADAIVEAWYLGEEGGTALADVLFGDYNPAGRLPLTFYASSDDLPDYEDYSMKGRTYRYFKGQPLYPFGHGLSYTTFKYGKAKPGSSRVKAGETLSLTIPLSNTGTRDGDEVVQVYVRCLEDKEGPEKSLRGFKRVSLRAGEKKNVMIDLPPQSFEFFDTATNTMLIKAGTYEILYGGSSDNKTLRSLKVTVDR